MRVSKKRMDARLRITKMQLAILDAMEELGANETETALAMIELQSRWANDELIKQTPRPKD